MSRWFCLAVGTHAGLAGVRPAEPSRQVKEEVAVWQRRHWGTGQGRQGSARHFDYIHFNPGKHGYVSKPLD